MGRSSQQFSHIIDVDGQLIGIDTRTIDAATLRNLAGIGPDRELFLVHADSRRPIRLHDVVPLFEDQVLFFESATTCWMPFGSLAPAVVRAAA